MNKLIFLSATLVLMITPSCKLSDDSSDASGVFESTEVMVAAENTGKIMQFSIEEGQEIKAGEVTAIIDSTQLYLKKQQLKAAARAIQSKQPDTKKQLAALEQQHNTALKEKKRIENLVKAEAVNQKQLDDVNAQIAMLEKQIAALKSTLETTVASMQNEEEAMRIQIAQVDDQLRKCSVMSPVDGTVLVKYAQQGEITTIGKPLFKIADTRKMILRVYVTASQLSSVKTGQKVKVLADSGSEEYKTYEGIITWISSKSEFTPKTIQTRDERANLVYAVKVLVQNDGFLKIGMYGQLSFNQ